MAVGLVKLGNIICIKDHLYRVVGIGEVAEYQIKIHGEKACNHEVQESVDITCKKLDRVWNGNDTNLTAHNSNPYWKKDKSNTAP